MPVLTNSAPTLGVTKVLPTCDAKAFIRCDYRDDVNSNI